MDDLTFLPESMVTINGGAYVVRLLTQLKTESGDALYRYISIDMATGNTIPGYDYIGPYDL